MILSPETRLVRGLATLCALLGLAVYGFGLVAVDFDFAALDNPAGQVTRGMATAEYGRLAMLCDILGFYLLQVPIAIALWRALRTTHPVLVDNATVAGLLYCLTGAIGAAVLSVAWPALTQLYLDAADPVQTKLVAGLYGMFTDLVYVGLWGRVEYLLCAIWWAGSGLALRSRMPKLGWLSIVLGLASLVAWSGNMMGNPQVAGLGLNFYMLLSPAWLLTLSFGWKG